MIHVIDEYYAAFAEYLASIEAVYAAPPESPEIKHHAMAGALKLVDGVYLHEHLQHTRPRRILEVGSFLGFSTRWLLHASREWGARVLSVDPGLRHRIFDRPRLHLRQFCSPYAERLDTIDACLSEKNEAMFMHDYLAYEPRLAPREALARMDDVAVLVEPFGAFDFAFIDGDHSFNATVANLRLVGRMMPQGGTILVHDALSWADVVPAITAVCDDTPAFTFAGVHGEQFHHGIDEMARFMGGDAGSVRRPLCDGLGLVQVAPVTEAALNPAALAPLPA